MASDHPLLWRPDLAPMPADLGATWVEIGGQVYGAQPDEMGPIGGGPGYRRLVTGGDFRVAGIEELRPALAAAQPGQVVYVEPDADMDFTALGFAEKYVIGVPAGVTLAGNRGYEGSRGPVLYTDNFATRPLLAPLGPGVRITGLWLRGPDPRRRCEHCSRAYEGALTDLPAQNAYYYSLPVSDGITTTFPGLEVDNCELSGWSFGAVHLSAGAGHHVHHNYIHHNQHQGLGYGVVMGYGDTSVALIERNLFDANRHSVAGPGKPGTAYELRHNVDLLESLSHNFDMHGGRDRKDGTDIAGDSLTIAHNQFRCAGQRAIGIRGVPREGALVSRNWFCHAEPGPRVILPWPVGGATRIQMEDNAYGAAAPVVR